MKGNVRKLQTKARRLMRLYSQWHETHQDHLQRKCMLLLSEILAVEPRFSLRGQFQRAF